MPAEGPPASPEATPAATVGAALRAAAEELRRAGVETPRLDAECLLAELLGVDRLGLVRALRDPLDPRGQTDLRTLVRRRGAERVPVAQLVGRREFWSLSLQVTPDVLIPRPETETLVEAALALLPDPEAPAEVLDVGTGSGAVALAIARERPRARITATDVSPRALAVAARNARALGLVDRLTFGRGSCFEPVEPGRCFDAVVSNPPYLAESEREVAPELAHEPAQALYAGPDGLDVLRALVDGVGAVLSPGGGVALEVAPPQADIVAERCRRVGLQQVSCYCDLAARPRVVVARRPAGRVGSP